MAKCKNCKNFFRSFEDVKPFYWCEKIEDSPYGEMERECSYYKPKTNAERIRSMTDKELAKYLPMVSEFICQPTEECIKTYRGECEKTEECAMKWLRAESEE